MGLEVLRRCVIDLNKLNKQGWQLLLFAIINTFIFEAMKTDRLRFLSQPFPTKVKAMCRYIAAATYLILITSYHNHVVNITKNHVFPYDVILFAKKNSSRYALPPKPGGGIPCMIRIR